MSKERLTINEAILHAKEIAKSKYLQGILCHANPNDNELDKCIDCGKEHEQLAEWLEELKQYRDLEEQGFLLRMPVAVGSKVYEIIEETVPKHHYYIAEYEVQDISAKAVMYADDWYSFDYPNLYFSRTEAEEKLRELEGK